MVSNLDNNLNLGFYKKTAQEKKKCNHYSNITLQIKIIIKLRVIILSQD